MKLADRIVADPGRRSGYRRLEGTRIRVSHILGWLAAGMSVADITQDYPNLTDADIRAALAFAANTIDAAPVAAE